MNIRFFPEGDKEVKVQSNRKLHEVLRVKQHFIWLDSSPCLLRRWTHPNTFTLWPLFASRLRILTWKKTKSHLKAFNMEITTLFLTKTNQKIPEKGSQNTITEHVKYSGSVIHMRQKNYINESTLFDHETHSVADTHLVCARLFGLRWERGWQIKSFWFLFSINLAAVALWIVLNLNDTEK